MWWTSPGRRVTTPGAADPRVRRAVFGLELQERRQKFLVGKLGPYEIDFEAWHSNLQGLVDFMRLLVDDLGLSSCVLLSGDAHYDINVDARFAVDEKVLHVVQLVSSSYKHSGVVSKAALSGLGRLVSRCHERLGWDRPPRVEGGTDWKDWLLSRAVNTTSGPTTRRCSSPRRVRRMNISPAADPARGQGLCAAPGTGLLGAGGENNVGLFSLRDGEVIHRRHPRPRRHPRAHRPPALPSLSGCLRVTESGGGHQRADLRAPRRPDRVV